MILVSTDDSINVERSSDEEVVEGELLKLILTLTTGLLYILKRNDWHTCRL